MAAHKQVRDICPVCGGTASYDFTGNDLMFDVPGSYDYASCNQCGALYQTPMPDTDKISGFYPENYEQYQPERVKQPGNFEKGALRAIHGYSHLDVPRFYILLGYLLGWLKFRNAPPWRGGKQALDIGCGNGKFLGKLQSLGWEARGVEFNAGAVDICRSSGFNVFHGDLHAAKFPDESFDMVSGRHLIEHLSDPNEFMAEVARILRPHGYFYVRTPNSGALGRKIFGKYWFPNEVPRHLVMFAPDNLSWLARRHGLKKIRSVTLTSPKFVLNSFDYMTGEMKESSKRNAFRRLLAKMFYVWPARFTGLGDEIMAIYEKQ